MNHCSNEIKRLVILVSITLALLQGCTTIPVDERNQIRDEVNQVSETTVAQMVADNPAIQELLDEAVGYAVASVSATKIPVVGGGYGLALLHDTENRTRTYINVSRFDLGAGVGAAKFRVLIIFENRAVMEKFRDGAWHSVLGADSALGFMVGKTSYPDSREYHHRGCPPTYCGPGELQKECLF